MKSHKDKSWWYEEPDVPHTKIERMSIRVEEDERDNWTGLYDAAGRKLFRPSIKFGFRR